MRDIYHQKNNFANELKNVEKGKKKALERSLFQIF